MYHSIRAQSSRHESHSEAHNYPLIRHSLPIIMPLHGLRKMVASFRTAQNQEITTQTNSMVLESSASLADNTTMFQGFEWYLPSDGQHYQHLARCLESLKCLGVDQVWLPPGCKAGWQGSNGYDVYDAYDLGEFDQKGSRGTKFGDKQALIDLSKLAQSIGVKLCWDAILNHRCAADYTEKCQAVKVDKQGTCSSGLPHLDFLGCIDKTGGRLCLD